MAFASFGVEALLRVCRGVKVANSIVKENMTPPCATFDPVQRGLKKKYRFFGSSQIFRQNKYDRASCNREKVAVENIRLIEINFNSIAFNTENYQTVILRLKKTPLFFPMYTEPKSKLIKRFCT